MIIDISRYMRFHSKVSREAGVNAPVELYVTLCENKTKVHIYLVKPNFGIF